MDEEFDINKCYCHDCNKARQDERKRILKFIENERDNGNCEPQFRGIKKGFSAGLCLSKLMKELEKNNDKQR